MPLNKISNQTNEQAKLTFVFDLRDDLVGYILCSVGVVLGELPPLLYTPCDGFYLLPSINSYPCGGPSCHSLAANALVATRTAVFMFFLHCVSLIKLLRHARAGGLLVLAIFPGP